VYKVAKLLQVLGMVLLPVGLFYGIEHHDERGAIATELLFVAGGAAVFLIGRFLESRAAR
jgi:low temperature requirement protein LtrA